MCGGGEPATAMADIVENEASIGLVDASVGVVGAAITPQRFQEKQLKLPGS